MGIQVTRQALSLSLGLLAACTDADLNFELMADGGSTEIADAVAPPEDSGPVDMGMGPTDMGVNPIDMGTIDAGTSTTPDDAGFVPDAMIDAGTSTVGMDAATTADAAPVDAGFAPDATPIDAGFAPDAIIPDAGFAPDATPIDAGFAQDAMPIDAGFAQDATPIDVGFAQDATPIDAGFAPDATPIDAGFAPDAEPPDTGVITTRMSFFITSRTVEVAGTPVTGGNLGGLSGADAFCLTLAQEADPTDNRAWRAYLSASTADAIDRIGSGPWYNSNNQMVASNVNNLIASPPADTLILDEQGRAWNGASASRHDVLTGSNHDGRKFANLTAMTSGHNNPNGSLFQFPDGSFSYPNPFFDFSCGDWTSNSAADYGVAGHADWSTLNSGTGSDDWSTSHVTACSQTEMNLNGGDIRIYCFATN